jgi:hypothetical protein
VATTLVTPADREQMFVVRFWTPQQRVKRAVCSVTSVASAFESTSISSASASHRVRQSPLQKRGQASASSTPLAPLPHVPGLSSPPTKTPPGRVCINTTSPLHHSRPVSTHNLGAMGIPIGWNIAREDAKHKDVLRSDVTGQRSPIRRRTRPAGSPRSQSAFDADFLVAASRLSPQTEPVSRSSHARTRLAPPPVPEVSGAAYRSSDSREPPSLQREDASFRRLQNRIESHARRTAGTRATWDSLPPLPALTPGFAPAAASHDADVHAEAQRISNRQDRARFFDEVEHVFVSGPRRMRSRSPRYVHPTLRGGEGADDAHESSDNAVGFPPLRRMGRRNIADGPLPSSSLRESWSPVSTVDGLGDRERSFSPSGESSQWDTFYGTIVPDAVAPTAESSFASAAASASFSNSHPSSRAGSSNTSASSSRTHLTVPSQHSPPANDQFTRACDTSDDDTASDTEAEEDTAPPPETVRHRYNPAILRRRSRPSYFSDEPPHRDTERYSRRVMERTRDASAYVRSFYSPDSAPPRRSLREVLRSPRRSSRVPERQVDGPRLEQLDGTVDGPAPTSDDDIPPLIAINSPALDQELREARSLLERLSRREDVSDDFWASVGLTRPFADRVEALESFDERDRP